MNGPLTVRNGLLLVIVAIIVAAVAFGTYVGVADSELGGDFWQTVTADFLAAALAVGVGIPVGLWLNDLAHRADIARQAARDKETRRQTLQSLKSELDSAYQWLSDLNRDYILIGGLSLLRWQVASEAGNLRLLGAQTLDLLALAYGRLAGVDAAHRRFMDTRVGPGAAMKIDGESATKVAARDLCLLAEEAVGVVEDAQQQVATELLT